MGESNGKAFGKRSNEQIVVSITNRIYDSNTVSSVIVARADKLIISKGKASDTRVETISGSLEILVAQLSAKEFKKYLIIGESIGSLNNYELSLRFVSKKPAYPINNIFSRDIGLVAEIKKDELGFTDRAKIEVVFIRTQHGYRLKL